MHPCLQNGSIRELAQALRSQSLTPIDLAAHVDRRIDVLKPTNAHLHFDPVTLLSNLVQLGSHPSASPLHSIPVSVKDLMDVQGLPTTCGAHRDSPSPFIKNRAPQDAAWLSHWRQAGACLVSKTHLNEHAYGITGENPWFGDCTLPWDPTRLSGGSSSGAAVSVAGGAAWIGLGTDTGGSLRVPAALCGLTSLRAPGWFPNHTGIAPLAPSFDALGWIQRHLDEVGIVARALPGIPIEPDASPVPPTLLWIEGALPESCESAILRTRAELHLLLIRAGWRISHQSRAGWDDALSLFAPLQAAEAWDIHRSSCLAQPQTFSEPVRQRLEAGSRMTPADRSQLLLDRRRFTQRTAEWLRPGTVAVLPATPMTHLGAGADQGPNRPRLLALTTPASLCNLPVLTVPIAHPSDSFPCGFQFITAQGGEWLLVQLADHLAKVLPPVSIPAITRNAFPR